MKEIELEKYLRNHNFPDSNLKVKINDMFYGVRKW